jgi:hypothetical protein
VNRTIALSLLAFAWLLLGATSVSAKEGVEARLVTPIPSEAAPGTRVTVVWTLSSLDQGRRIPFGASAVFIRLFGPDGARTPRAYGAEVRHGRFRASPRVPRGGVTRVVIGLMGTACDADGCRPSPAIFPIVGKVFR